MACICNRSGFFLVAVHSLPSLFNAFYFENVLANIIKNYYKIHFKNEMVVAQCKNIEHGKILKYVPSIQSAESLVHS